MSAQQQSQGISAEPCARNPRSLWARRAALTVFLIALSGCGFHPSGDATMPFETLFISAPAYSSFAAEIKRYLASGSRAVLVDRPEDAQATLDVFSEIQETQILSISANGRIRELQFRYLVTFRLRDKSRDWIGPTELVLHRDMTYDDQAVLAKDNEQALLFQDMKDDAVRQIIRRLSAARVPS
jgi:LPS-assembly lipoprotein